MKKKSIQIVEMLVFIGVFIFALWVHLYRLGEIPFGLNVDEIGIPVIQIQLRRTLRNVSKTRISSSQIKRLSMNLP